MTKRTKRRHESGTPEKEDGSAEELKAFIAEKTGEAVREIKRALDQRMTAIEESLNFAYETITVTVQKTKTLEKGLAAMHEDFQSLRYRVAKLEQEREESEKTRRRMQLIFSGNDLHIPENDSGIIAAISALINRLLELEVRPGQIISVKRLPRSRLLATFAGDDRGSLKEQILRAKYKLRGQKVFIQENLTPMRQGAFKRLLQARREGHISTVLTRGGEVLFALSKEDRLMRARCQEEAEYLLSQITDNRLGGPMPPYAAGPGAASAPHRSQSRDLGRAALPLPGADPPAHEESVGAGACSAPPPGAPLGEADPLSGGRPAQPSQLGLPLRRQLPQSQRDQPGGGVARWPPAALTAASVTGRSAGDAGTDLGAAPPADLGPPLAERPGDRREGDQRSADTERGERRQTPESGELTERGRVPASQVHQHSPLSGERRPSSKSGAGGA